MLNRFRSSLVGVRSAGLEPATWDLRRPRSIQLSYERTGAVALYSRVRPSGVLGYVAHVRPPGRHVRRRMGLMQRPQGCHFPGDPAASFVPVNQIAIGRKGSRTIFYFRRTHFFAKGPWVLQRS